MQTLAIAKPIAFILVRDREKAKAFYSGVLGLTLVSEDNFAAVYDLNGMYSGDSVYSGGYSGGIPVTVHLIANLLITLPPRISETVRPIAGAVRVRFRPRRRQLAAQSPQFYRRRPLLRHFRNNETRSRAVIMHELLRQNCGDCAPNC